jgi:hypothetical protein
MREKEILASCVQRDGAVGGIRAEEHVFWC